ncbi:HPr family phosphocarrier protein [Erythrobacter arachoides]|uniref:HPr family phosphocarrier protein n=1 Tax=Aurantiacibacter arachoides TaxID=1850444 RepID=A0A845A3S5_9SPHN|nr:HPr family phosphocarrier protein [Aurantiacibacter arachoides]MXO93577.1 HPr family phosphocarrier protein [Aurantiacibacter arachoides]GGD48312.1 phosphocarrier protein HPr [Aurantiacibacter arachoides]
MDAVSQTVTIVNKRGLHARASAKFVAAVAEMDVCRVTVTKDGTTAGGGSILGLMMLGAAKGDTVTISAEGAGSQARLAELVELVETGFGEE